MDLLKSDHPFLKNLEGGFGVFEGQVDTPKPFSSTKTWRIYTKMAGF